MNHTTERVEFNDLIANHTRSTDPPCQHDSVPPSETPTEQCYHIDAITNKQIEIYLRNIRASDAMLPRWRVASWLETLNEIAHFPAK